MAQVSTFDFWRKKKDTQFEVLLIWMNASQTTFFFIGLAGKPLFPDNGPIRILASEASKIRREATGRSPWKSFTVYIPDNEFGERSEPDKKEPFLNRAVERKNLPR